MKGFFAAGGFRLRSLGLAALIAGTALLLAPDASAKDGNPALRSDLALGAGGEGSGAEGDMVLKQNKRGDRLKLRLRNLEPKTLYDIVDESTDQVLKTIRTNRRGGAKVTLRSAPKPKKNRPAVESSLPNTLEGIALEIRLAGGDEPVLEGNAPDDGGDAENGSWIKHGTVASEPDASVQVSITLSSYHEAGMGAPYDSICLSVSPGMFWIAGEEGDPANGGFGDGLFPSIFPLPDMPEIPEIPGPVTFWIRGHGNELEQVASIEAMGGDIVVPLPGDGGFGDLPDLGDLGDLGGFGFPTNGFDLPGAGFFTVDDNRDDGTSDGGEGAGCWAFPSYYFWCADSTSEEGLPLGVNNVESLQGRAFEVRDGDGVVLLSGDLPHMEMVDLEPAPLPEPGPIVDPWTGVSIEVNIDVGITIGFGDGFSWTFPMPGR